MSQFINIYSMLKVNTTVIRKISLQLNLEVNHIGNAHQSGQAMSEALSILGVFFLLLLGIQATTSLQLTALQLLLDSGKKVFQINLGSTFSPEYPNNHISKIKDTKKLVAWVNNHSSIFSTHPLFEELNMIQPGSTLARSKRAGLRVSSVHISRQSFIEAGTGYASSDQAVQTRIGTSATLWLDAFNRTIKTVDSIHTLSSKVDSAWNRPAISRDFIKPWAGVIPEQSLLQRPIWRN